MDQSAAPLSALLEECEQTRVRADMVELHRFAELGADRARREGDRRRWARFEGLVAFSLWRLERATEARDRAAGALDATDELGSVAWRIDLRHTLAMTFTSLTSAADGLPHAHEALRIAREHVDELGHGAVSWSLNRLAVVIDGLGDTPRAIEILGQAADVASTADADDAVFAAKINIGALARLAADRARVEGDDEQLRRYARLGLRAITSVRHIAERVDYWRMLCAEHEASLHLFLGDPIASLDAVAEHRGLAEAFGLPAQVTVIALTEVRALLTLGRIDEAKTLADRDLDPSVFDADDMYTPRLLETRMLLLRALERFEEALDVSEQLRAIERRSMRERVESQMRHLLKDAEVEGARIEAERLREQAEELEQVALEDPLTGLANRRALERHFERWHQGDPKPDIAVAVLDIDHFKRVNDRFGHEVGDVVLVVLAGLMNDCVRAGDLVARNGGEEFVLVLADCPLARAVELCERLRRRIRDHRWDTELPDLHTITVSVGLTIARDDDTPADVLRRADLAMYRAKREGRDRLDVLTEATTEPATAALNA